MYSVHPNRSRIRWGVVHRRNLTQSVCAVSALLGLCWLASPAAAVSPRINNLLPHGGQRGTQIELVISGTSLDDAEEILLDEPGLEVVDFQPPDPPAPPAEGAERGRRGGRGGRGGRGRGGPPQELHATIKIAPTCPLGSQRLRVRTQSGLSNLINFYVGPLPVVEEKEPNTDFEHPQVIPLNVTVHGRIDREDNDYYVVECKKGDRLTAEVFGMRLGSSTGGEYFDPYVAILDASRFELVASDDTPLVFNDAVASIIAPADGKYTIQIRDAAYNGDGNAYYLLSIGNFPRPSAVYPAGGQPGETLEVKYLGDVGGEFTRPVTLPTSPSERFAVEVQDDSGFAPSDLPFRVNDLPSALEVEPNNDRAQATPAEAPGAMNGVISQPGDVDQFKFTAKKGQVFEVEAYARRLRSPLDPVLTIHRADNGQQLAGDDDARAPDSYVRFTAPEDGDYIALIRDHLNRGGPTFVYRIEATPVSPHIDASPIEFRRYEQPQIVIPRGAAFGIVANVERRDFGGPVTLTSDDLPEGVHIECPEDAATSGQISLLFQSDEDALIGGNYAAVTAKLNDPQHPDNKFAGPLSQKILMIRGPNDARVLEERETRLPIVITEPAPFRVWIDPPQAPLVRGGSMQLAVHCERDPGFNAQINLQVLRNPPGCGSNGSINIPPDKTEAAIPINAAGNAELKDSLIAVRAFAQVGRGQVELCTPLVPLRVEEQYIKLEFVPAVVEQGKETPLVAKVIKQREFEGEAEIKLLNLPGNATAEPLKLTKDTTELTFTVKTAPDTPRGNNKNVLCQAMIPVNGELVLHSLGGGQLRVDPPPPAPPPTAAAGPAPATPPPATKVLSRLEQLRLEQRNRVEAEAASGGR